MSDFVECPDVAEFAVEQHVGGQKVVNVFHILRVGGWDITRLESQCDVLITAYNDDFAPHTSAALVYDRVKARDLTVEAGMVFEKNFPTLSGGDRNIGVLPSQNAYSVQHLTGVAGRSYRGRTSFAGIPIDKVTDNLIASDYAAQMVAGCDTLKDAIESEANVWVVLSRYRGYTQTAPKYKKVPTPRATGIATPILSNTGTLRVGSQDSRNK